MKSSATAAARSCISTKARHAPLRATGPIPRVRSDRRCALDHPRDSLLLDTEIVAPGAADHAGRMIDHHSPDAAALCLGEHEMAARMPADGRPPG